MIQALQVLHSTPSRPMFSCCVLCVCAGEARSICELSALSLPRVRTSTESAQQLLSPGREPQEDEPQGEVGQVGGELLRFGC